MTTVLKLCFLVNLCLQPTQVVSLEHESAQFETWPVHSPPTDIISPNGQIVSNRVPPNDDRFLELCFHAQLSSATNVSGTACPLEQEYSQFEVWLCRPSLVNVTFFMVMDQSKTTEYIWNTSRPHSMNLCSCTSSSFLRCSV